MSGIGVRRLINGALKMPSNEELVKTRIMVTQVRLIVYCLAAEVFLAPTKYPTVAHETNSSPAAN